MREKGIIDILVRSVMSLAEGKITRERLVQCDQVRLMLKREYTKKRCCHLFHLQL